MTRLDRTHRAPTTGREHARDSGTGPRRASWRRRLEAARTRRVGTRDNRALVWRLCVPAVFLLAGALFITSANSSEGTDLRAGRYSDLGSLVRQERANLDEMNAESSALQAEIDQLTQRVADADVERTQARAEELRGPAGLEPVTGPGLTVTLTDAPEEQLAAASDEEDRSLIVHQQDIQAVANAMWAGGAEAMTIQDQRIVSTTGIKCVGNTVILHGVPYSPPYEITAIGDPDAMLTSLLTNSYIELYLQYAEQKDLGWDVEAHDEVKLPGYEVVPDLKYARSAGVDEDERPEDSDI